MVPIKLGMTEEELLEYIKEYYSDEAAEHMVRTVKESGYAAYGAFAANKARLSRDKERIYNLFRVPGYMPPKRSEADA